MTINYNKRIFSEQETFNTDPLVGYISPSGKIIDFTKPFGESGHDGWDNEVTNYFLRYICYILKDTSIDDLKNSTNPYVNNEEFISRLEYPNLQECVMKGLSVYLEDAETNEDFFNNLNTSYKSVLHAKDTDRIFIRDILSFYKNIYSNPNFLDSFNTKIEVLPKTNNDYREYFEYVREALMKYFKDICVMYLGYDSIERFKKNGEPINGLYKHIYYEEALYSDPEPMPRIITTSYNNINERFYNYILMDWTIHRIPKYYWNATTKKYEVESVVMNIYKTEKEQCLEQELQSIKRLVPTKDRIKYFR